MQSMRSHKQNSKYTNLFYKKIRENTLGFFFSFDRFDIRITHTYIKRSYKKITTSGCDCVSLYIYLLPDVLLKKLSNYKNCLIIYILNNLNIFVQSLNIFFIRRHICGINSLRNKHIIKV